MGRPGLISCLSRSEPKPPPNASLLSKIFGLTFAEAKLAAALAGGTSLDTAAEELDISRETARSQLKIVFARQIRTGKANSLRPFAAAAESVRCRKEHLKVIKIRPYLKKYGLT